MSRFIIIVLIVMLLSVINSCSVDEKEGTEITTEETTKDESHNAGYYQYEIDETMNEKELIAACKIPEQILKGMTDEQLAQAVAEFPLLFTVYLSSQYPFDTKILSDISDAYRELLTRNNAKNVLIDKIRELEKDSSNILVVETMKEIVLYEATFADSLTEDEKEYLEER